MSNAVEKEINPDLVLTDKVEIDIIELSKVKGEYEKNKNNKNNKKAQWALFINDPNTKEVKEIMKDNKDIEDAVVTVHKMTEDEKMRKLAFLREKAILDEKSIRYKGYEDGHKKGMEDGMAEGMKKMKDKEREIVLNMKKMNMTDEEICNILNITQKELEELTGK